MTRHGFPVDLLRRLKRRNFASLQPQRALSACDPEVVCRRVKVAARAAADSPFVRVFAGIEQFPALAVYVHGSWSDGTMTPFSDYDDLVIVDYERISDERELGRMESFLHDVDMRFCRLDPLQHHGHWIVAREELDLLDESYIPLSVLEGSVCVQGESEIGYQVDLVRSRLGARRNIAQTCDVIEALYPQYASGRINLYDMKRLAGSFFMLPAYILQAKGEMVSKRDAISRCTEVFGAAGCSVISRCTTIRSEWGRALETASFQRFCRIGRLFKNGNLHRRYARAMAGRFPSRDFPHLESGMVSELVREARAHASD